MASEFKLPELGENIESADIVKVLVAKGDIIEIDQILIEIETDKATVEVPSDISGVIKDVLIKEGETAKVGQVLLTIETNEVKELKKEKELSEPVIRSKKKEIVNEKENKKKTTSGKTSLLEIKLPELGENIEEADIVKVLVKVGDKIEKDQSIIEIETDKAAAEVPADLAGVVKEVKVKEGDKIKVGQIILILESGTEKIDEDGSKSLETEVEKMVEDKTEIKKEKEEIKKEETKPSSIRTEKSDRIVPAAPSVRRFAREIGIDIHNVSGSGPGGRISIDDVKIFAKSLNEQISQSNGMHGSIGFKAPPLPDFSKWGNIEHETMTNVRKKTAEHLSYAWAVIPHVTQFDKADITELDQLRKQFSPKVEKAGGKLTVTAVLLKIVASALKIFPQFNSSIDMEKKEIIYKKYYHIGIAVDTDRGLLVPVIRDVDKKNIIDLSVELNEISQRARDKKLTLEEMQGGTFSISNLGGIGGTGFTPVVNSPEVAILGVSRGSYEPVYNDGQFEPRLMLPLTLSYDHRIIDGADGIRFLKWIVNALEETFLLSLEG